MKNKNTKTTFKYFSIPEWKKEEQYLREQHKNGWKFVKVNFICLYHFEKCEKEDVIYQLDYNPQDINNKDEYIQMFEDLGWEYLQDYVGYSYFRKAVKDMQNSDEEIFCDDYSRFDMIKRVFKGKIIPLIIIFFCIIIPQMFLQSIIYRTFFNIFTYVFPFLFIIYLIVFIKFGYHFYKYWQYLNK